MSERTFKTSFGISIAIHLLLIVVLVWIEKNRPERPPVEEPLWIEVDPIAKQPEEPNKQVVDSNAGKEVEEAVRNAYLGEKNRVVEEEKVARERRDGKQGAPTPVQTPKPEVAQNAKTPKQEVSPDSTKFFGEKPLSKFGLGVKVFNKKPKQQDQKEWHKYQQDYGQTYPEYVQGVKESETTALNTKEFVYFAYYKRIREQLDQAWRPLLKEKIKKYFGRGRTLASEQDHITKTMVVLDQNGNVVKVQVLEESGIWDLDDAAVKAFNKAGPFPNPPTGIIDGDGNIKIRWDFILKS